MSFGYFDFDFAIHDQVVWNIGHGSAYSSILGINFLGNHIHLISFLVAPFYLIFNHPLTLLFLQTLSLALAAIPIYKTAKSFLGYRLGLAVALVYLLYPGLGFTNLYEFHPTVFATLFLSWMFYYFYQNKTAPFVLFMILSMICQENISLGIAALGLYGLCAGRNRLNSLIALISSVAYFIFCIKVLLPYFNQNTIQFIRIYGQLGGSFPEIFKTILTDPLKVIHIAFQPQKIKYLIDLFCSLSFVPLLNPLSLILSVPFLAQHLLSSRISETTLVYHYTAELIPPLFMAFIFGLTIFRRSKYFVYREGVLAVIIIAVALLSTFRLGPHFNILKEWQNLPSQYKIEEKKDLVNLIPKDASVISTFEFLPHLSHRKGLYSFHHIYSGFFTLSGKPYQYSDDVSYALIDFNDSLTFRGFYYSENYRNIDSFLKQGNWGVLDVKDSIVLFKKGIQDQYSLLTVSEKEFIPSQFSLTIDDHLELYGYQVETKNNVIDLVLYWKLLKPTQKDVNIFIDFIGQDNKILDRQFRPIGYRIWPTQAWRDQQSVKEHQYISIPPNLKGQLKQLKIGFYDFNTGGRVSSTSKDPLGRVQIDLKT